MKLKIQEENLEGVKWNATSVGTSRKKDLIIIRGKILFLYKKTSRRCLSFCSIHMMNSYQPGSKHFRSFLKPGLALYISFQGNHCRLHLGLNISFSGVFWGRASALGCSFYSPQSSSAFKIQDGGHSVRSPPQKIRQHCRLCDDVMHI